MSSRRGPHLRYVPLVAAMLLATSACDALDSPNAEYGGVCVDEKTQQRLPDDRCGDWDDAGDYHGGGTYMMWFPMSYGGDVPGVGQRAYGGTRTVPGGKALAKGVPSAGATAKSGGMSTIQRGGFGVKAGTSGGTGAKAGGSGGS
jgi:hypothetical protein